MCVIPYILFIISALNLDTRTLVQKVTMTSSIFQTAVLHPPLLTGTSLQQTLRQHRTHVKQGSNSWVRPPLRASVGAGGKRYRHVVSIRKQLYRQIK